MKNKHRGFGPLANYADRATAACWRSSASGLVVRVFGYRSRGPGFDFRRFQFFSEAAGLERGPLSLVRITEELLGRNSSGSGQENRD
jgi:hypothetical protein